MYTIKEAATPDRHLHPDDPGVGAPLRRGVAHPHPGRCMGPVRRAVDRASPSHAPADRARGLGAEPRPPSESSPRAPTSRSCSPGAAPPDQATSPRVAGWRRVALVKSSMPCFGRAGASMLGASNGCSTRASRRNALNWRWTSGLPGVARDRDRLGARPMPRRPGTCRERDHSSPHRPLLRCRGRWRLGDATVMVGSGPCHHELGAFAFAVAARRAGLNVHPRATCRSRAGSRRCSSRPQPSWSSPSSTCDDVAPAASVIAAIRSAGADRCHRRRRPRGEPAS